MTRKAMVLSLVVGIFCLVGRSLAAHHSGFYDHDHPVTLSGIVTKYEMTSPHGRILFDVKDERGNIVSWIAVTAPPQRLYRAGWNTKTLTAGDRITITGAPTTRPGIREMRMLKVVTPGGKTLSQGDE